MTSKEDIDEKLVKWNEIFDELTLDARSFIKDIQDMINYIAMSAGLLLLMGVAAVTIAIIRNMGTMYIAASVIIFCILAGNSIQLIRKWQNLRIRYNKLYSIQSKIES